MRPSEARGRGVLIGADLGTTHCTVMAIEPDGTEVAVTREPLRTRSLEPGWADQDARDWWEAFARAARECVERLDGRPVLGVGLTSHLEAWVPLDADGEPLHPGLLWLDLRTAEKVASVAGQLEHLTVFEVTGVTPDYLSPAVKIAWIREALGPAWSRVTRLLSPKDVLVLRLTGQLATDPTIASKTMLYDSRAGRWADAILDATGIPAGLLPPVAASTQVVGRVTPEASAACGIPAGVPVVAGAGDDHTQALAGGAIEPGDVSVNTGTSSCMKIITDRFEPRLQGLAESHSYVTPGRWLYWLPMGATGYFVDWFIAMTANKDISAVSQDDRIALDRSAATVPAGSEGLLFLPYAWGARLPETDQSATGGFVGIRSIHCYPHFARAVLEGVAYQYAYVRRLVSELPVESRNVIRVLGGETRSPLWTQIKSDVTGCAIEVPRAPEASAFGASLLAGVGAGVFRDVPDAIRQAVTVAARYEPDPASSRRYQALFEHYDSAVRRQFPGWPAAPGGRVTPVAGGSPGHGQADSRRPPAAPAGPRAERVAAAGPEES